jgi:iron complex transport system substrate-binding protein
MRYGWLLLLVCASCSSGPAIPPGGIVSNNPCIDAILAEVAVPGQIAAVSAYSHDPESGSAPLAWARARPALGVTAEEIIVARPRLVLTGNLASNGTNAALAKAGIRTQNFGVPSSVADSIEQVRLVAQVIGRKAAGERLVGTIEREAKPLSAPNREAAGRKSAIIWQAGGFVAGKGTLQDELLVVTGFRNASDAYGLKQWDILPLEALIRKPPDVIFMPLSAKGEDARSLTARTRLLRHTGSKTRIVAFPDKLLFCGGPTIITAMKALRS